MTHWLVIGSSPHAPASLARARATCREDVSITCNGGILLEPAPDYYVLGDYIAMERYGILARVAQKQRGTHCVIVPTRNLREKMRSVVELIRGVNPAHAEATEQNMDEILGVSKGWEITQPLAGDANIGVDWADEVIDIAEYEAFSLSGYICVEYAAKHGASTVTMVGMDGYIDGPGREGGGESNYFDGLPDGPYYRGHSQNIIPQKMDALCRKYPHVDFVSVGKPNWTPLRERDNLRFEA